MELNQRSISKNSNIVTSIKEHTQCLVKFQCEMAQQTEHLKLNQQLVRKAVKYIHEKQGYGFYFVGLNNNQKQKQKQNQEKNLPIISSLMVTFQHQQSWWIQSVYVQPQSRRQGNFTKLFKQTIQTAKQRGVKMIRLYAQKQNEKAKETYKKLGMNMTGQIFYGFDMIYSKHKPDLQFSKGVDDKIAIENAFHHQHSSWKDFKQKLFSSQLFETYLQNTGSLLNNGFLLLNKQKNQILGYCQYFHQFSDWRYGFMLYINILILSKKNKEQHELITKILMKRLLIDKQGLSITALRFLIRQDELQKLRNLVKGGAVDDYDVMGINL